MAKLKAGITGTGSLIGQGIIKSIKKSGIAKDIDLIGFDYFKDTVGSFWVKKNFLLPDILKKGVSKRGWLERVIDVISSEAVDILFIGIDFELELFALYREIIEAKTGCRVIVSSPEVIKIADDKYLTYKFLKSNGLYYPETFLPEERHKKNLKFPCFVKPRKGSRSRDVFIASNRKELDMMLSRIDRPLIQELIGDPAKEYTCGIICFGNEAREAIVLRRELKDGNTAVAYFKKNVPGSIYDYVYEAAERLKPFGACNFQLRLDNNGIPKIFEINARHSGTTYIRSLFGFNEVEYIISYLFRGRVKRFKLKEGIVKRYYDELFITA